MKEKGNRPSSMILVLAMVCTGAGLALGAAYRATRHRIEAQQRREKLAALRILLPDADREGFREISPPEWAPAGGGTYYEAYDRPLPDPARQLVGYARQIAAPESAFAADGKYYEAYDASGRLVGYALETSGKGYSSTIALTVGVDARAELIRGIKITSQQETPGLGANCEALEGEQTLWDLLSGKERRGPPTEPRFQRQFRGKRADSFVKKGNKYQNIDGLTGATITTNAVADAVVASIEAFRERVLQASVEHN